MKFLRWRSAVFAAAFLVLAAAGCSSLYDNDENWVVRENDTPEFFAEYDVFYLYPSYQKSGNTYLNWMEGGVTDGLRRSVALPLTSQFGPRVRAFSPFVPQLNFEKFTEITKAAEEKNWDVDWSDTPLDAAIKYATMALERYIDGKNPEHPFVLQGYGQGALILYEAMKRCSAVKRDKGFVAAYFFGLPGVTPERIEKDFGRRGIKPATDRNSVGVIAVCNIRTPGSKLEETYALRGGAVINPINWRTDATPATPKEHAGAVFCNAKERNPQLRVKVITGFCGAVIDTENALVNITDLRPNAKRMSVPRSYDPQIAIVFGLCVSRNAGERVRMYKFETRGLELPERD